MPTPSLQGWESYEQQLRTDWERTHPNIPGTMFDSAIVMAGRALATRCLPTAAGMMPSAISQADWANWQVRQPDQLGWQFQQRWEELQHSIQIGWEQALREGKQTTDDRRPTTDH